MGIIFNSVAGGGYTLEELVSLSGPGIAVLLVLVMPVIYGGPIAAITTELATAMPVDGGPYAWARRGLGRFASYEVGLLRWVNSWIEMALYPVLFSTYLSVLFVPARAGETVLAQVGPITIDLFWLAGVVLVIIPLAVLNVYGAKVVGKAAIWLTIVEVTPLMVLGVLGITRLVTDGINPIADVAPEGMSNTAAFGAGLSLIMWFFYGFDRVGAIAGEIKNPERVIPKAMAIASLVIVASYLVPLVGALAVPGWEHWEAGSFGGPIGAALGGTWLQIAVTVGGMACAIGVYSALLLSNSRMVFVLSRDRWISPVFARQTTRSGSPVVAIIMCSVIYAAFSLFSFIDLVVLNVFLVNLVLLVNLVTLIALRIKEPDMRRPAAIPGGWFGIALVGLPLTAVIFFVTFTEMSHYGTVGVAFVVGTLALCALSYIPARAYQRRHGEDSVKDGGGEPLERASREPA